MSNSSRPPLVGATPSSSDKPIAKGKRPVTTCLECTRRKQKCNRERPCNICVARNVPEKCLYPADSEQQGKNRPKALLKDVTISTDRSSYNAALSRIGLEEQIGYAIKQDSNVFADLNKSMGKELESIVFGATTEPPISRGMSELYKQLVKKLPSFEVCKELISHFFSDINWYFTVLERSYFDKLYDSWLQVSETKSKQGILDGLDRDHRFFPSLLFQVIAVSLQFLPIDSNASRLLGLTDISNCEDLSHYYSDLGHQFMNILGRHRSCITAVQCDLVRAVWLKNCARGTESWYATGDAIRQAQDLRLHLQSTVQHEPGKDFGDTMRRMWYDEYKRRLWVTLFSWDGHMAMILGRPRMINAEDCTIKTPVDCEIPTDLSQNISVVPGPEHLPSYLTVSLFHYHLARIYHEVVAEGVDKPHCRDYSVVNRIHNSIDMLVEGLPPSLRMRDGDLSWDSKDPSIPKKRYIIASSANALYIALHRAHATIHLESRDAALKAALNCLDVQERLFAHVPPTHYRKYTLAFYTVDSGMFLAALALKNLVSGPLMLHTICRSLAYGVRRLEAIKVQNPMAETSAKILTACYWKIQELIPQYANDTMTRLDSPSFWSQSSTNHQSIDDQNTGNDSQFHSHVGNVYDGLHSDSIPSLEWQHDLGSASGFNDDFPQPDTDYWMEQMAQIAELETTSQLNNSPWSSILG